MSLAAFSLRNTVLAHKASNTFECSETSVIAELYLSVQERDFADQLQAGQQCSIHYIKQNRTIGRGRFPRPKNVTFFQLYKITARGHSSIQCARPARPRIEAWSLCSTSTPLSLNSCLRQIGSLRPLSTYGMSMMRSERVLKSRYGIRVRRDLPGECPCRLLPLPQPCIILYYNSFKIKHYAAKDSDVSLRTFAAFKLHRTAQLLSRGAFP